MSSFVTDQERTQTGTDTLGVMVTTVGETRELAQDKLAVALPRRWAHVQGVGRRTAVAAPLFSEDGDLLVTAAVLHDLGYAPGLVDTGFHPVDGARYLRSTGAPARLTNLVAHHSCAVLEAAERGLSAELAEFEDEGPTALRDALWWADMTTTRDGERTTIDQQVREIQDRYGPESFGVALHTACLAGTSRCR